jgi:hypothetical protein
MSYSGIGPAPPAAPGSLMQTTPQLEFPGGGDDFFADAGVGLMIGGIAAQAISAYYGVKAAKAQADQQAQNLEFASQMANLNARVAERGAQNMLRAGQWEKGQTGLRYGQVKESVRASQAAAGIQGGVGSAAEVLGSIEMSKRIDQLTISRNAVRSANAAFRGVTGIRNAGRMALASAGSVRAMSGSMSPYLAGATSLLGGGFRASQAWYRYKRTT